MAKRPDGKSNRPNSRGSSDYDAIAAMINSAIDSRAPNPFRMATAKTDSDNRVRVRFDDNGADGDEAGHAHGGGKKRAGDKVLMVHIGEGNYVALGPIMEDGRKTRNMISGDEIERNSIDSGHLREKAITRKHFDNRLEKVINGDSIERNAIVDEHLSRGLARDIARAGDVRNANQRMDGHVSRLDRHKDRLKKLDGQNE